MSNQNQIDRLPDRVLMYEKFLSLVLLILYCFTFGRKSLNKYLEGGVAINIKEEVMNNVEPPGKYL